MIRALGFLAPLTALTALTPAALAQPLSPAQKAAGWVALFDGSSTDAWRGFRADAFPARGWSIEDGTLKCAGGGGDLITRAQFADFELELEWKAAPRANSGIMFRVAETLDTTWQTGPEFQILDDFGYGAAPTDMHAAGSLYDLAAPSGDKVLRPAGEFNHARIVLHNGRLRHWLNGVLVAQCRTDDASWTDRIAASKFKDYPGFGLQPRGHIALQDHGDTLWFRNIRIRDLDAPMPGEINLLSDPTLANWTAFVPDLSAGHRDPKSIWKVRDGVLVCSGSPAGYLRTNAPFDRFVLKLEWRFLPDAPGNSGVLFHIEGEDKVWPACLEAQLHSGSAGDIINIGNLPLSPDPARTQGRRTAKTAHAEHPVGEWNEYEIIVDDDALTLFVNHALLNHATGVVPRSGPVALQSEGVEIHFRNIRIAPINP